MRIRLWILVTCLAAFSLMAADPKSAADAAYKAQKWEEAARLYAEVAAAEPENGTVWFRLGTAYQQSGKLDEAIAAYKRAAALQFAMHFTQYNLASAYARKGDAASAYEWLAKASAAGYRDEVSLAADPDFAALRDEPKFRALLKEIEERAHPCRVGDYRALDFWVGEWAVRDTRAGHGVGTSSVQRILDDCVVLENWTGGMGDTGKSFNTIDPATRKWRQTWTDSSGQIHDFTGESAKDTMIFTRKSTTPAGAPSVIRLTLSKLPNGEVRQLSEYTTDEGKSWQVGYDFTYKRK